jgi:hypothetical protein
VPVEKKKTNKIRVCVDFRNLNRDTPKDEYPMPIAEALINYASGNKIISFLDGNARYNQIFMAKEDVATIAFRCPGFVGLFEWVVMKFGLKNVGAMICLASCWMFTSTILRLSQPSLKIISPIYGWYLKKMRKDGMKMNPLNCAFGELVGQGKLLKEVHI